MAKTFIGIDVGKSGAVSLITEQITYCYTFPKIKDEIDCQEMYNLFEQIKYLVGEDTMVALEDVHSIFGVSAKSNFQFGWIDGVIEAFLVSNKFPYFKVSPKVWQKEVWQGVHPIMILTDKKDKEGNPKYKIDTKGTSLLACKRLFPNAVLTATERSKKPHDGIVDSLLLAEYCKRKYHG